MIALTSASWPEITAKRAPSIFSANVGYGLPRAISGINSFWERGYGEPPPQTLIVIGFARPYLDRFFASCQLAGHTGNRFGVKNEETEDHPDIFVCRGLLQPWPQFWKEFRYYG